MSNVEKEYQNRFFGKQESNDNFDKESLWNSINSNIHPNKKNRKYRILWLSIGILFLSSSILYFFSNTNHSIEENIFLSDKNYTHKSESQYHNTNTDPTLKKNDNNTEQLSTTTETTKTNSVDEKSTKEIQTSLNADAKRIQTTANNNKSRIKILSDSITTDNRINNRIKIETNNSKRKSNINFDKSEFIKIQSENIRGSDKSTSSLAKMYMSSIPKIKQEYINYERPFLKIDNYTIAMQEPTFVENEVDSVQRKTIIDIYGGINQSNISFKASDSSIESLQNESNIPLIGNTFGASISHAMSKNIIGTIGIEHNNLWTQTKINISNRTTTLLEDELVRVILDSESLDTIEYIYQDTTVGADYQREIVHHNNIRTISIPFQLGYRHTINKFDLGINMGLVYSIRYHQNGKGYDHKGNIVEYNSISTSLPYDKMSFAIRLAPRIRYNFNDSYSALISPIYQYSSGTQFMDTSASANHSIWHITLGFGKSF